MTSSSCSQQQAHECVYKMLLRGIGSLPMDGCPCLPAALLHCSRNPAAATAAVAGACRDGCTQWVWQGLHPPGGPAGQHTGQAAGQAGSTSRQVSAAGSMHAYRCMRWCEGCSTLKACSCDPPRPSQPHQTPAYAAVPLPTSTSPARNAGHLQSD